MEFFEDPDPYALALTRKNIPSVFLPPFQTLYINQSSLKALLMTQSDDFLGLVITSQRALTGISLVFQDLLSHSLTNPPPLITLGKQKDNDVKSPGQIVVEDWKSKPLWVVGPGTEKRALTLGFTSVHGGSSGSSFALSQLLLSHAHLTNIVTMKETPISFLYLVGESHRKDLEVTLKNSFISLTPLILYKTIPNPNFGSALSQLLDSTSSSLFNNDKSSQSFPSISITTSTTPVTAHHSIPKWIVFFSPRGVELFWDLLSSQSWWNYKIRLVCIGQTTTQSLHAQVTCSLSLKSSQLSIPPCYLIMTATTPTPEGILACLLTE